MTLKQTLREQGIEGRRFEYDDRTEFVVDFGPGVDASVDIVDGTALVVVGDEQYDVDLEEDAEVFMTNGVLTFEVRE